MFRNANSLLGNELDIHQGETLSYIMDQEYNEHWWLTEDNKGQVICASGVCDDTLGRDGPGRRQ